MSWKGQALFLCKGANMTKQKAEGKTTYRQIIDGDIEPQGEQKGWINLEAGRRSFNQMDAETLKEISRKGAQAVNKLHGEKKTAKQALERILSLKVTDDIVAGAELPDELAARLKRDNPDATLYDLIQLVAVGRAVSGSMKAAEYVRDTFGDKPIDKMQIEGDITTEADRALMASIARRLADTGAHVEVVRDIGSDTSGQA